DQYFLGDSFYQLPELTTVKELLVHSIRGIRIDDPSTKKQLKNAITRLIDAKGVPKIYSILEVLHSLSQCAHITYLSSNSFVDSIDQSQDHRINQVYEFVMKNFTTPIAVDDVASLISMTPTSF